MILRNISYKKYSKQSMFNHGGYNPPLYLIGLCRLRPLVNYMPELVEAYKRYRAFFDPNDLTFPYKSSKLD